MNIKPSLVYIRRELVKVQEFKMNINYLTDEAFKFYNNILIDIDGNHIHLINTLSKARTFLNNCVVLLKSFIEPEKNSYISDIEEEFGSYKSFLNFLGITNALLDTLQGELTRDTEKPLNSTYSILRVHAEQFKQLMIQYMENLIVYPLRNSLDKYKFFKPEPDKNKLIVIKDKDLFVYFLFIEILHSVEVLGALARQLALEKKLIHIKDDNQSIATLSEIPLNAKTQSASDYKSENLISEISEPFADFEVDNV